MKNLVWDIETNGLLGDADTVHCIALYDLDTEETMLAVTPEEQKAVLNHMTGASLLVGHNICQYDLTVLKELYGWVPPPSAEVYDTLVAGCILWPEEIRSIEDWVSILRLSQEKVQNEDWSVYTEHMGKRCVSDTVINAAVYKHIKKHKHEPLIGNARLLEQAVAGVHAYQMMNRVCFDVEKADALYGELDDKIAPLREQVIEAAPKVCLIPDAALKNQDAVKADRVRKLSCNATVPCKAYLTKDGKVTADTFKYFPGKSLETVKGPYTKVSFRGLNPDSSQEVKALLLDLGWEPTEYNVVKEKDGNWRSTSPKLTEDSYDSLPSGLGKTIATYNTLKHRRNFLQNAKDPQKGAIAEAIRGGGRVTAHAFTCATPTARYRHNGVICNIPRVTSIYGRELRSLFGVPVDSFQVGIDLAGIEARALAHYLLRGSYTRARETADLILSPDKGSDFHSYNAKVWGVDRDTAKTCLYALMYGAGAKKLARILDWKESQGAKVKKEFYEAHPAIKELIDDLVKTYRVRGYILSIDGRPLYCRGENKILNQLLQNCAAVVFKKWMVLCDTVKPEFIAKYGVQRLAQMIAYHDEVQYEVKADEATANQWGRVVCQAALAVGEEMKILVPISAEYKVGHNWSECH